MNINFLKRAGIITVSILGTIYLLFLVLPFIITPIANKYLPMVSDEITKATGLNSKIEGFRIVTTPKFTIGAGIKEFELLTPDNKEIFKAENAQVKMSLLPLLAKKIELDLVKAEEVKLAFNLNKDGSFEIEKYLPKTQETAQKEPSQTEAVVLPLGLRLSNHLPDIKIGEYDIEFIDLSTGKKYEIEGDKTEITDFILNKEIKITLNGKAKLN